MLKLKTPIRILAIVPGTKYLGVALFYGSSLRDWRVKCLNGKGIENRTKKAKEIISNYIQQYSPQVLAIKKLDSKRSSENLNSLARKIREFTKRKGLITSQLRLSEIKGPIAPGQRINKKELAKIITSRYPELLFDFEKEKKNRNTYYQRMFEAVALGLACFYKADGNLSLNKEHGKK